MSVTPIQPHYVCAKANTTITLGCEPVEVTRGGLTLPMHGTALLQLAPRNRVIIAANTTDVRAAGFFLTEDLSLRFGPDSGPVPVFSTRSNLSNAGFSSDFLPYRGRLTLCRDRRIRLREAVFHILNFPDFLGTGHGSMDFDAGGRRLGRVVMRDGDWLIEIQALPHTHELVAQLNAEGGNAITHVGRLVREDGRSLTVSAAERAITSLHQFLSFACGRWTAIFGIVGIGLDGALEYRDWGMRLSMPWESRPSWFDRHHAQSLAEAYPGFARLMRDPQLGRAAYGALYWYLRSNRGGEGAGIDGGLILSQAALERLAYPVLRKAGMSPARSAADNIRRALANNKLPVAVPQFMPALRAGKRKTPKLWADGPDAIVRIRNDLVHAEARLPGKLGQAISEGSKLAQWYVELLLLRLCGFDGVYSDRRKPQWVGAVETVPWVRSRNR